MDGSLPRIMISKNRGDSPDLYQMDDDDDSMERNSAGRFDDDIQIKCMNRSGSIDSGKGANEIMQQFLHSLDDSKSDEEIEVQCSKQAQP